MSQVQHILHNVTLHIHTLLFAKTKFLTITWAASSEFGADRLCEQRRFRRACASAQSRKNLRCSLIKSSESRGTFRQKARSLVPLHGWACAVTICHDGRLEDTNSLVGAHLSVLTSFGIKCSKEDLDLPTLYWIPKLQTTIH